IPATRKTSRIRLASAISGPAPKNPREPSSPESEIPATQASEPAIMTAAVTIAERMLPGPAMVPPVFLSPPFQGGVARSAGVVSARNHTTPPASPAPLLKRGGEAPRTCDASSDYAIGAQPGDLAIAHAQHLAQDLLGVLPQHRRCEPVLQRRPRKAHRARHQRHLAGDRMLELDLYAARLYLRLLEHLRDVVDRSVCDTRGVQQLDPFARRFFHEDRLQQAGQLRAVLDALAVRCEAR